MLTKIILFPARLLYTLATGKIGENKLAADYYADNHKNDVTHWVKQAYQWRTKQPDFIKNQSSQL